MVRWANVVAKPVSTITAKKTPAMTSPNHNWDRLMVRSTGFGGSTLGEETVGAKTSPPRNDGGAGLAEGVPGLTPFAVVMVSA
jgi:hypothetical protein